MKKGIEPTPIAIRTAEVSTQVSEAILVRIPRTQKEAHFLKYEVYLYV